MRESWMAFFCRLGRDERKRHNSIPALAATLLVPSVLILNGCFASITAGGQDALKLETAFHQQMTSGDLAGIYANADDRYRSAIDRTKSDALFSSISRKLGAPLDCKQGNTNISVGTSGTTMVSVCTTTFSKNASAIETFTWAKYGDTYRLRGYHINSNELIER